MGGITDSKLDNNLFGRIIDDHSLVGYIAVNELTMLDILMLAWSLNKALS